jgi:DNA-3-methyladenine glycosylase I
LEENKGQKIEEWVMLFKKIFKFTGGEITKEFLISTGTMDGAHIKNCPIFNEINH